MHISDKIAGLLTLAGFTARPAGGGMEYAARVIGVAPGGDLQPSGARVMRYTIDASGRWLASVDAWGAAESDCDLRDYQDAGAALRAVSGAAWPAIAAKLETARAESSKQSYLCRCMAGLAKGAKRDKLAAWASEHGAAAMELDNALSGPLSADILAMSDDELAAVLAA